MRRLLIALVLLLATFPPAELPAQASAEAGRPRILAHYMPWYQAPPQAKSWGWHWTMNHFDPEQTDQGRRSIASHFYPLIGPYDSSDPWVLRCQLLQMKLAGIDGVIVDWYGLAEFRDYAQLHRNTMSLLEEVDRVGMKLAICYEDQTIAALVEHQKILPTERVPHAVTELRWLAEHLFDHPAYLQLEDRPVLLSFGQQGLSDEQWSQCLEQLGTEVAYFSQHHRRAAARGVFDWPLPREGMVAQQRFQKSAGQWPVSIPVAFPRFVDIYQQAGVHQSWGTIDDNDGQTMRQTLQQALDSGAPLIQIATWNDWGEGTMIEPSVEFGYRDLQEVQRQRRRLDPAFPPTTGDLELPAAWLARRRWADVDPESTDALAQQMARFELAEPRAILGGGIPPHAATEYRHEKQIAYVDPSQADAYRRQQCQLEIYYPVDHPGFATIVWFHPGGLTGGQPQIPDELKNQGLAVIAVGYRLYPQVKAPGYIEDAAAAVAWAFRNIQRYGGSPKKIFVAGHSAGGYLTSMVGLDKRWLKAHDLDADQLAGLISYSGHSITHMTVRRERGVAKETPWIDELAPLFHVRQDAPPMLLLSGDREKEMLGRYEETAYFWRMLKVAGHPDVGLIELQGTDHGGMAHPGHAEALKFVRRVCQAIEEAAGK